MSAMGAMSAMSAMGTTDKPAVERMHPVRTATLREDPDRVNDL